MTHASGTFEVKLTPQATDDKSENAPLGRMSIDKQFHGDLEGTSRGEMLTAGRRWLGRLRRDRAGHRNAAWLERQLRLPAQWHDDAGVPQLSVTVVPDSGTRQLVGLSGRLTIEIADGKHSYEFEYTLAETP